MPQPRLLGVSLAVLSLAAITPLIANPIINEVMYHADSALPEDLGDEWIELHNPAAAPIDLSGYTLDNGVEFTFPPISIPAGGYLVVAADLAEFGANFPAVSNVVGPWIGKLRNSGEKIALRDALGVLADEISYADEGEWATRARGEQDNGHRGWTWVADHDGGGSSLELINPALSNKAGQNWSSSLAAGGTPGAANSVASVDIAPLIRDVQHRPRIPNSGDEITVRALVTDEGLSPTVTLHWRLDGAAPFTQVATDQSGSEFSATIPAQADGSIVEFYITASDGSQSRTWPAAVPGFGQVANALFQVDDSHDRSVAPLPGVQPIYRLIMTEAERAELAQIGSDPSESDSNAQMNGTMITVDGVDNKTRYRVGIRIRGNGSRNRSPNNYRVNIPTDNDWYNRNAINLNTQYTHSQLIGAEIIRRAGIVSAAATAVQVRVNGADLANAGSAQYGSYAFVEPLDSAFAERRFPLDPSGNVYRCFRQGGGGGPVGQQADLRWEGNDPDSYRDTYFKSSNSAADDYSDLIGLIDVLNNAPAAGYVDAVRTVADVDQWLRHIALDSLLANRESGLNTGDGDDYALYSGAADSRFRIVPHDLDTVLGEGNASANFTQDIFNAADVAGLSRILDHPDIIPLYYAELLELLDTIYNPETLNPLIDETLGNWVPVDVVERMKLFITNRIANVQAQIPQAFSITSDLAVTQEGLSRTTDGAAMLSGTFHAARTLSVLVNGVEATLDAKGGTWMLPVAAGSGFFKAGINRVPVQAFGARAGGGAMVDEGFIDVFYDTGALVNVSGTLAGGAPQGSINLSARDSYVPGVPILVRVDLRNDDGSYNQNAWDATATLTTNQSGILLTPNTVTLHNGLGSALVSIGGGGGGAPVNLISTGGTWKYLDDGSNQNTAWRANGFNDDAWKSGDAELGYGDDDETTEILFGPDPDNDNNDPDAKFITTYFRKSFNVADASEITNLSLRVKRDDGVAVYLNGTEVALDNIPSDPGYLTEASNGSDEEDTFLQFSPDPALLADGTNTIAVEIHQDDAQSSDISFDLELIGTTPGTDPGNFTLTATVNGRQANKGLTSLGVNPAMTTAPATVNTTTWSGIIHVTGDVTVPAGETLTIAPGTLIVADGTAQIEDENGFDLIVRGTLNANGTEQSPITFTATDPDQPWGWIMHDDASPSTYQFTNITRAGHSPKMGHTDTGPALRIVGSAVTFDDCSIANIAGKVMITADSASGDSSVTFRRCHLTRSSMGPELFDTALLLEDSYITEMLQQYREDGIMDDNDAIYLHAAGPGQELRLRNSVLAQFDDDGIDTASSDVIVENCIIRDVFDKGLSVNGGNTDVLRSLVVDCAIGMEVKQGNATATVDRSTFAADVEAIRLMNDGGGIAISNSIIRGTSDSLFGASAGAEALVTASYSDIGEAWPGTGNITTDPAFVAPAASDYHLTAASPCRDTGDPAENDPDASRADMGKFPHDPLFDGGGGGPGAGEVRWTAAGGPYHVIGDVTVPTNVTLVIDPGTSIYFDADTEITVDGIIKAVGTPSMRIRMTSLPGAPFVGDIRPELPDGPPHWDGIQIRDSLSAENIISHVDIEYAQSSDGSIGVHDSEVIIDNVTFRGTHQRMIYTDTSSVIIQNCVFPDMFGPTEFPYDMTPRIDNAAEHIKGSGGIPDPGHYIIRNNRFGTNKGHNDVIDIDSNQLPAPILQILGNEFAGAGDEAVDGGGDIFIDGNRFANFVKDRDNDGTGDSNGISTGDSLDTVMMISRNVFTNMDHIVNFKKEAFGYVENNTVVGITAPHLSLDTDPPSRLLDFSAINFLIPNEIEPVNGRPRDPAGLGAYTSSNLFIDIPQSVFGHPDQNPTYGGIISQLEVHHSVTESADVFANADGTNGRAFDYAANGARFLDKEDRDYRLLPGTPGVGIGANGIDAGAIVPAGATISGEPIGLTTSDSATLTIGGPAIFSFVYQLDDGPWSSEITIGNPRTITPPITRRVPLELTALPDGDHTVHVRGRNFAGELQAEEDATVSRTWTVNTSAMLSSIVINEVLAANAGAVDHEGTLPDIIELYNNGTVPFDLSGMSISDHAATPRRYVFPASTIVNPGEFLTLYADIGAATGGIHLEFALDDDGEAVYLYDTPANGGGLVDSIQFGAQIPDLSVGRLGANAAWGLALPTIGDANVARPLGDFRTLKINEFLASGAITFTDDFIELYNPDSLPVALGGLFLTDDHQTEPGKHEIAALSFIAGDGFTVFLADGNLAAGPAHVSFNLDASLESIGLFGSELEEIDLVLFGPQTEDHSQGRATDGTSDFSFKRLPTPGLSEGGVTTVVRQLDLLDVTDSWSYEQSGTDLGTAWRAAAYDDSAWPQGGGLLYFDPDPLPAPKTTELALGERTYYFRKTFTVDEDPSTVALLLSAYIDDGAVFYLNGAEVLRLGMSPPPSVIEHATLASRGVGVASLEGPFSIPADELVDGDNVLAVEVHQRTSDSSDIVFGLELAATVTTTESTGDPGFDNALAIFDGLRITEIMFNPIGSDEGLEYLELSNVGTESIDLTGVRVGGGVRFTFPAMVLAPGEYIVLSPDLVKFQARYGSNINVVGPYAGKLNNGGEDLLLQLPEPYNAGILRFDYNDWYQETDGDGASLNLINPLARRDSWGDRDSWEIGALGGSPGSNFRLDAGAAQVIVLPADATLSATLSEGGAPVPTTGFTLAWSQISGSGIAEFSQPGDLATDVSFSSPGTYVLAIEALGNGTSIGALVTITVNDIYEAWALRTGAGLPHEDDEGDMLSNLLEYALDLDPAVQNTHPLTVVQSGSDLVFGYTRYLRKIDITYQAQASPDLGVWNPATEEVVPGSTVDTEPWQASLPATDTRAFWRLLIEKQ